MGWLSRARSAPAICGAALLLSGCSLLGTRAVSNVPDQMTVTSPDVTGGVLGSPYTCRGKGLHPGLHWSGVPAGTRSIAILMDDAAAPISPYIYWIVFGISPQTTDLPTGRPPSGVRQARNSKGTLGYDPPCPQNPRHGYRLTVYALGKSLSLPNGAGLKTTWTAIAHAAIARGTLPVEASP